MIEEDPKTKRMEKKQRLPRFPGVSTLDTLENLFMESDRSAAEVISRIERGETISGQSVLGTPNYQNGPLGPREVDPDNFEE